MLMLTDAKTYVSLTKIKETLQWSMGGVAFSGTFPRLEGVYADILWSR